MLEALGAGSAQDTGPLMTIAAGIPPHAIYVNFRLSATYIGEGFLVPLEQLVARLLSDDHRLLQTDVQGHWRAQPNNEQLSRRRDNPSEYPIASVRSGLSKRPHRSDTWEARLGSADTHAG